MIKRFTARSEISSIYRYLLIGTTIAIFILIILGGVVRVTGSGGSCPDWPTCFGRWVTPDSGNAVIEYFHRIATFISIPLVLISAYLTRKYYRKVRFVTYPIYTALIFFILQVFVGAFYSLEIPAVILPWITVSHFLLSLAVLGGFLIATVTIFFHKESADNQAKDFYRNISHSKPFSTLSLVSFSLVSLLLLSGLIVSATGAGYYCGDGLLCGDQFNPGEVLAWVNLIHRFIVLASGLILLGVFMLAWKTQSQRTTVLVSASAAVTLFIAQALMGFKLVDGFAVYLLGLHQATSLTMWAALLVLILAVGYEPQVQVETVKSDSGQYNYGRLFKDLLMLTKPIVVALLLVTTFAGMVIGAQRMPPLPIIFWTLLAGFLAAGGSGAINQYIDRFDDGKMQRTQKRPIPSGRLSPGQGLAFGVILTVIAFFIMVSFVNFLAAMLTLAGTIYYVLIYSILLKKTTVQNIVIGGGAGAIPPLVGWAAATGSLNIPALFLFVLVFMWTPPHFWALALVRKNDYARAGVPMLPVVRGEEETRWQIFLYTILLVGVTLLFPLFGLGGSIYFIGATLLGAWIMYSAWKVWKGSGNKVAWKMYRYSSMYLAFIFLALMVDRIV